MNDMYHILNSGESDMALVSAERNIRMPHPYSPKPKTDLFSGLYLYYTLIVLPIGVLVFFGNWAYHSTQIIYCDRIIGHVFHYDTTTSDNDITVYGYTRHYLHTCSYPYIITYLGRG